MSNFDIIEKLRRFNSNKPLTLTENKLSELRDILHELPKGLLTEEEIKRLEEAFDTGKIKDITPRYITMLTELKDAGISTKELFASNAKGDDKYVEVVSAYIKHVLVPRTGHPVEEGLKQLKQQYAEKIKPEVIQQLEDGDPTETKKYFGWMAKQYVADPGLLTHILDLVRAFFRAGMRRQFQGQEADIYHYATVQDLDAAIESTRVRTDTEREDTRTEHEAGKKSERESMQDEMVKAGDAEIKFENDLIKVTQINTHEASKAFQNTPSKEGGLTWCTTREHPSYWNQYEGQGVKFYYMLDKRHDRMWAAAISGDEKNPVRDIYDDNDKTVPYSEFGPYLTALMQGEKDVPLPGVED